MEVRLEDYDLAVADATEEKKTKPKARRRTTRSRAAGTTVRARKSTAGTRTRSRSKLSQLASDDGGESRIEALRAIEASAISAPSESVAFAEPVARVRDAIVTEVVVAPAPTPVVEESVVVDVEQEEESAAPVVRVRRMSRVLVPLMVAVFAVAASAGAFLFLAAPSNSQSLTEAEVQKLVASVGELIILPTDETPLVASVVNAELLRASESFYRHASDGNILLLYTNSGRAILYDRERDIIVNIGTLQNPPPAGE